MSEEATPSGGEDTGTLHPDPEPTPAESDAQGSGQEPEDDAPGLPGVIDIAGEQSPDEKTSKHGGKPDYSEDPRTPEPQAAKPDQSPTEAPPAAPAETPAPEPFSFGGENFESREAAEQNFRSMRGQFKESRTLQGQLHEQGQTIAALQQQLHEVATPPPPAEPEVKPADPNAVFQDDQVKQAFHELAKTDPASAAYFLTRKAAESMGTFVREQLDEAIKPLHAFRQQQEEAAETHELVHEAANYKWPGSNDVMFPELRDPVALREIGTILRGPVFSEQHRLTPQAICQAVNEYRFRREVAQRVHAGGNGSEQPTSFPVAPSTPPPDPGAANAAAAVTQAVAADRGGEAVTSPVIPPARPVASGVQESYPDRLRREMDEVGGVHPDLGFDTDIAL